MKTEGSASVLGVRSALALAAAYLFLVAPSVCLTERIRVNGGQGWDGVVYADMVVNYRDRIHTMTSYRVQRMLPPLLVRKAMKAVAAPMTVENVIKAFVAFNLACLAMATWAWWRVARRLSLGPVGLWTGFIGLFVNFATLKQAGYYPVLTDSAAFAIGLWMVECRLHRRFWLLIVLGVAGAFTWPTLSLMGLFLTFGDSVPARDGNRRTPGWLPAAAGVAAAGAYCCLLAVCPAIHWTSWAEIVGKHPVVWPLSAALAASFLAAALAVLANDRRFLTLAWWMGQSAWARHAVALAVFLATAAWQRWLTAPGAVPESTLTTYLFGLCSFSTALPGLFLVAHVAYFGPVFLLAACLWPAVCRHVCSQGIGYAAAAAMAIGFSLDSESRHLVNFLPLIVPFVALVVEGLAWDRRKVLAFALASLFASKVWQRLNATPFDPLDGKLDQNYFMTIGPWMSLESYLLQGGLALILGYILCDHLVWRTVAMRPAARRRTGRPAPKRIAPARPFRRAG